MYVIQNDINLSHDSEPQGCFSPKRAAFRFTGFAIMCLNGFCLFFCYNNPAALQNYFKSDLDLSPEKYTLLYSIFFWPNIITCFVGGYLLDSIFGIRWGTFIYMVLTMMGQLIFALGSYVNMFWLMVVGRFFLGIGSESLIVAQKGYITLWFKGKELNMVFGILMSFVRLGSTVNFLIMENIYNYVMNTLGFAGPKCIGVVLFFAALILIASMIGILILDAMDIHAGKVLMRKESPQTKIMNFRDIKDFKTKFWLVVLIIVFYYIAIGPFLSLAKTYFITKYKYDSAAANTASSLVFIIAAVTSPIFGFSIDKTGKNILWAIAGIIGAILCHTLLAFTYVTPYACMVILGLSLSVFASSMWPCIALLIPLHQLGTAYGMTQSLECAALAVAPLICGIIVDKNGYVTLEIFFIVSLCLPLVTGIIICILDKRDTKDESDN